MADKDLKIRITGDSSSAEAALKRLHSSGQEADKGAQGLLGSFGKIGGVMLAATAAIGALTVAFNMVKNGLSAMIEFGKGAIDTAVNLGRETLYLQRVFGMTAEDASGLIAVFQRFGLSAGDATRSMTILEQRMTDAASSGGTLTTKFGNLGIKVQNADGSLRNMKEVMMDVSDAFKNSIPPTERAAVAKELFGRSGVSMIPTLIQGRDGINQMTEAARKMGIVLGEEDVEATRKLMVAKTNLSQAIQGLKTQIGLALIPYVERAITVFMDWVNAQGGVKAVVDKFVIPALRSLANGFADMLRWLGNAVPAFGAIIKLFSAVATAAIMATPGPITWKIEMVKAIAQSNEFAQQNLPKVQDAFLNMADGIDKVTGRIPPEIEAQGADAVARYKAQMNRTPAEVQASLSGLGPAVRAGFDKSVDAANAGKATKAAFLRELQASFTVRAQIDKGGGQSILESFTGVMNARAQGGLITKFKALGGVIQHLATGGLSLFQPQGTDTVPAMLTPGEYVVKKEAVDRLGTDTMDFINQGKLPTRQGPVMKVDNINVTLKVPDTTPLERRRNAEDLLREIANIARSQAGQLFNQPGVFVQP